MSNQSASPGLKPVPIFRRTESLLYNRPMIFLSLRSACRCSFSSHCTSPTTTSPPSQRPLRYAVLGAGFAGLSVVWHLLQDSPKELPLSIDIYDEVGIGGGASGIAGGLLHPYSPKAKLLWRGADCWKESIKLLTIAQEAVSSEEQGKSGKSSKHTNGFIVQRRGILRPPLDMKNLVTLNNNAQNCLPSCRIEKIDEETAQNLLPHLCLPFNTAFYMPEAVNINSERYLQALFLACKTLVNQSIISGYGRKELNLQKQSVQKLADFEGKYDGVIICLGARVNMLPEIAGRLPLRTCRGVIAHMELPEDIGASYPDHCPSILSDAWLAVQGPRRIFIGSTWEWKATNSSPNVSADEASKALAELMPKASAIYPALIKDWVLTGARAGLRAMPPLTSLGSLPLLGSINDVLDGNFSSNFWLFGGLGSRGLLYHAWLGKLIAQAVLACDDQVIPSELTSWKNVMQPCKERVPVI